jgi:hypothetical protein
LRFAGKNTSVFVRLFANLTRDQAKLAFTADISAAASDRPACPSERASQSFPLDAVKNSYRRKLYSEVLWHLLTPLFLFLLYNQMQDYASTT